MVCVEPATFAELSVVTSAPEIEPAWVGVKSIASVQLAPMASIIGADMLESCGQVDEGSKLKLVETLGLVPLDGGEMVSGAEPSFSRVTVCGPLLCPTTVLG